MRIKIENRLLENYPEVHIGFLVAQVEVRKLSPEVESLKQQLASHLQNLGMNATNFTIHPKIAVWRSIYENAFQVKPKTYRSSIESLLRRVLTGQELWRICNVVDLYNCCSILSLLPMGGYDLDKISGDIHIRYGNSGEVFYPLGGKEKVSVQSNHVVYADGEKVLCWLWNHKDSKETAIDENTKKVVFFIDGFSQEEVEKGLKTLAEYLKLIGCIPSQNGVLHKNNPLLHDPIGSEIQSGPF